MSENYCDICKDQEFFCPKCKTKAVHMSAKALHGQIPSVTKIQGKRLNSDLIDAPNIEFTYDMHNFMCIHCNIIFGLHDLGKPTRIITE